MSQGKGIPKVSGINLFDTQNIVVHLLKLAN